MLLEVLEELLYLVLAVVEEELPLEPVEMVEEVVPDILETILNQEHQVL
jgi:hypothetical protein